MFSAAALNVMQRTSIKHAPANRPRTAAVRRSANQQAVPTTTGRRAPRADADASRMQTDGSMVGNSRSRQKKSSNAPIIVIAIIVGVAIVAGGAFAAGVFDPPKRPTPSAQDESPQRNQPAPVANRSNTPAAPTPLGQ